MTTLQSFLLLHRDSSFMMGHNYLVCHVFTKPTQHGHRKIRWNDHHLERRIRLGQPVPVTTPRSFRSRVVSRNWGRASLETTLVRPLILSLNTLCGFGCLLPVKILKHPENCVCVCVSVPELVSYSFPLAFQLEQT